MLWFTLAISLSLTFCSCSSWLFLSRYFSSWNIQKREFKTSSPHGNPLCYNVGYYSGVAEANFENTDNHNCTRVIILCSPVCPSPNTANFCAGYVQGYSHTYAGHIPNSSEVWNQGFVEAYTNGENMNFNYPINGTNPASCNEGPAAFCDGYAQAYPHGIENALGRELGAKAADD